MSGCGCECGAEFFYNVPTTPISTDPRAAVRGAIDGEFNSVRPVACIVHAEWCRHRPTKAVFGWQSFAAEHHNGTLRAFVEATRDLSKYVFADLIVEQAEFPYVPTKTHFHDGSSHSLTNYTPLFGLATGDFVFAPRDTQDDDSYTKSPWPLSNYPAGTKQHGGFYPSWLAMLFGGPVFTSEIPLGVEKRGIGARLLVRCGSREDNEDNVVASFMFPHSAHGSLGFDVAIGCHWADIADENANQNVRCGLEVTRPLGMLSSIDTVNKFGHFSFPFELPRSLFVGPASSQDPPHYDVYRYCGAAADAQKIDVPLGIETTQSSMDPGPSDFRLGVTCAADLANVIVDTDESDDVATVPYAAQRDGDGPVTTSDPYFARRPDIIARVPNTVANADSWHATHLVRRGSPLAARNALHNLHLEFVEADRYRQLPFGTVPMPHSPERFPVQTVWGGQKDWGYPSSNRTPIAGVGPHFFFRMLGDELAFWIEPNDENLLPPLWAWNSFAGSHVLTPFVGGRRLFPNSYHAHSGDEPLHEFKQEIEEPDSQSLEPYSSVGPYTEAQWAAHEAKQCPVRKADYRVAWRVESYPQIWATTSFNESFGRNRPLDVPLEDSGMTTENYDAYARRNNSPSGGINDVWWSWSPSAGAVISVRVRLGLKWYIESVRGYRRVRQKVEPGVTIPGGGPGLGGGGGGGQSTTAHYYASTGAVKVAGDHECKDEACTEHVFDFEIRLDESELISLSAGEEIKKDLLVGQLRSLVDVGGEYVEGPMEPVYRTVAVRVSRDD